ncbi:MAG: hypothetical protein ACRD9L_04455 [Bryobacteraceae bacterium]
MLWMKGWLETRWRLLFAVGIILSTLVARAFVGVPLEQDARRMMTAVTFLWLFAAVFLAGAGIKTQAAFQATKGLHGSTYVTLSLPVSRFRLLAVRAGIGFLETAGIILLSGAVAWALFPMVRAGSTLADLIKLVLTGWCCTLTFYAIAVLVAVFLDEMWQVWGTLIAIGLMKWLTVRYPPPPSLDVFRAIGNASPLLLVPI